MTRQAPPRPLPGSPVRGSSMVWLMRSGYPTLSLPVTGKSAVHRVGRDGLQVGGARALVEAGEDLAHRRHVLLLVHASRQIPPRAQRLAQGAQVLGDVLERAEMR